MNALEAYLGRRCGHGISDEHEEAYILGFNDALDAILDDEVYYGALDGKPGMHDTLYTAVRFMREGNFVLPGCDEDDEN